MSTGALRTIPLPSQISSSRSASDHDISSTSTRAIDAGDARCSRLMRPGRRAADVRHGEAATGAGSRTTCRRTARPAHASRDAMSASGPAPAAPVVRDLNVERIARPAEAHLDVRRPGVLDCVGQRLLHDSVRAQVKRRRDRARLTVDPQGVARPAERVPAIRPSISRAGLRGQRSDRPHRRAPLTAGASPPARRGRTLDRQRHLGALGIGGHHHPRAAGLEHHHRDAVRNHIVQLSRDPRSLPDRRDCVVFTLGVDPLGTLAIRPLARAPPRTSDRPPRAAGR